MMRVCVLLVVSCRADNAATDRSSCMTEDLITTINTIHGTMVQAAKQCESATSDMFQRVSGHVGRHRIAELCAATFACWEDALDLLLSTCDHPVQQFDSFRARGLGNVHRFASATMALLQDFNGEGYSAGYTESLETTVDTFAQLFQGESISFQSIFRLYAQAIPALLAAALQTMGELVNYQLVAFRVQDMPEFLSTFSVFPTISRPLVKRAIPQCAGISPKFPLQDPMVAPDYLTDVAGLYSPWNIITVLDSLKPDISALSYSVVALLPRSIVGQEQLTGPYQGMFHGGQSSGADAGQPMACNATGLAFSPAACLHDRGWASLTFTVSTEPPFDGTLSVTELSHRGVRRTVPFVQPVVNETDGIGNLMKQVDQVYKTLNTPTPDLLYVSPMLGNCKLLENLGSTKSKNKAVKKPQLSPRLIIVGFNPLIPPTWRLVPDFPKWHRFVQKDKSSKDVKEWQWWFGQCSLQSTVDILEKQGYQLLQVEQSYAWFLQKGYTFHGRGVAANTEEAWLQGWHCLPTQRTFAFLLVATPINLSVLMETRDSAPLCEFIDIHEIPTVESDCGRERLFLRAYRYLPLDDENGKRYLLESQERGRCFPRDGTCECFPPYIGRWCSDVVALRVAAKPYRAALHYLVGELPTLLNDLTRTLAILWQQYNRNHDYPVIIFHDGLSAQSRRRLVEASDNNIWFSLVEDFTAVPRELKIDADLGGYSLGYRGMCRFRAGPVFTHPVLQKFDYAFTLDSDGYFPALVSTDPLQRMHEGGYVYAYSHISRDQPSAVQHFWEFSRLYMEYKGIDPKSTPMLRRLTDALILRDTFWHEWNRLLFMNDIEIVALDWFRSDQYQDYFHFMDSIGGFWRHRWGDHALRTLAIAMHIPREKLMKMEVPYGHQAVCRCGRDHPGKVCQKVPETDSWLCVVGNASSIGEAEVGVVDDRFFFDGD